MITILSSCTLTEMQNQPEYYSDKQENRIAIKPDKCYLVQQCEQTIVNPD